MLWSQRAAAQAVPPRPQPPQLTAAVVPAHGVVGVRLPMLPLAASIRDGSIVLRVTDQAGAEVAGEVSNPLAWYLVFRPAEPLVVGASYTLQLAHAQPSRFERKEAWMTPLTFSVAAPGAADVAGAIIEPAYIDVGETQERCCGTACFVTAIREGVVARLSAQLVGDASVLGQYVYAFDWENRITPMRIWSSEPLISVLGGPAFEPCRVLYAYSLADDTEHLLGRACVDEDKVIAERVRVLPIDDALAFDRCEEPPDDLVARWCEVNAAQCTQAQRACPGYAGRCGAPPDTDLEVDVPGGCSVMAVRPCSSGLLALIWLGVTTLRSARRRGSGVR